jgi:hypothetical protein
MNSSLPAPLNNGITSEFKYLLVGKSCWNINYINWYETAREFRTETRNVHENLLENNGGQEMALKRSFR